MENFLTKILVCNTMPETREGEQGKTESIKPMKEE